MIRRSPSISSLLLALPFLLALPAGAAGLGDDYRGWKLTSFAVRGSPGDPEELRRGLALRQGAEFYPKLLEQDLSRIRLHLARTGYPRSRVYTEFVPRREKQGVDLLLRIEPGRPVLVAGLRFAFVPEESSVEIPSSLPLKEGTIFREDRAAESADAIRRFLKERGRAFAEATLEVEPDGEDSVRVLFRIEPGEVVRFRGTVVRGAADDLAAVAIRAANIRAGARYHPDIVADATVNLRLLGLFRLVRASVVPAGPGEIDLLAELTERKPRSIEWGLGFWTDEGVRTRARWEHRNLFRAGRGGALSGTYSRYLQSGRVSVWTPSLLGTRNHGTAAAKVVREEEDSYRLTEVGGELSVRRRPSAVSVRTAVLSISNVTLDEKTDDPETFLGHDGLLTTLMAANDRNTVDDRLYPSRGNRWEVSAEWGLPGRFSENHFLSLYSQVTTYLPAVGTVLAFRLAGGAAEPTGNSDDLLPNKRFYSGGASSMRGFRRRKLGPLDRDGSPIGGEALIESSLEWRFPIAGRISGAAFADAGQVWSHRRAVRPEEMEVAVGPSLIIRTPVGPVRGDWAYRLTDYDKTQPRSVFHLIVGNPF